MGLKKYSKATYINYLNLIRPTYHSQCGGRYFNFFFTCCHRWLPRTKHVPYMRIFSREHISRSYSIPQIQVRKKLNQQPPHLSSQKRHTYRSRLPHKYSTETVKKVGAGWDENQVIYFTWPKQGRDEYTTLSCCRN